MPNENTVKKIYATLQEPGRIFALGDKQFLRGVPREVTPEEKERLATKTTSVTIQRGDIVSTLQEPRFKFSDSADAPTEEDKTDATTDNVIKAATPAGRGGSRRAPQTTK